MILVLVLMAAYRGLTAGVAAFVGRDGIDLWIAPKGTDNLIRSSALLQAALVPEVAGWPEVREAAPLLRGFVTLARTRANESVTDKINVLGIGYRSPDGLGGPPRMVEGRPPKGDREVALDRAAAFRVGASLGDTVQINGRAFTVVGLSGGTNLIATQFVFLDESAAAEIVGLGGLVSFIPIELPSDASPAVVAAELEARYPQVAVFTRADFVANNVREVAAGFRPLQLLVSVVALITAAAFVAFLVHALVEERQRDLAVLLAVGAPVRAIVRGIVANAVLLVFAGGAAGALIAAVLSVLLRRLVPTLELAPQPVDAVFVIPLFLALGVLAGLLPVLRLRRIDPVEAFRP
jgi:putative ABC transport system permease protein